MRFHVVGECLFFLQMPFSESNLLATGVLFTMQAIIVALFNEISRQQTRAEVEHIPRST